MKQFLLALLLLTAFFVNPQQISADKPPTMPCSVFIPGEISWRFKLYPSPEQNSPTWAGRIDDITAKMDNVTIQVRPSNSKTEKLGPPILTNHMKNCCTR